MKPEELREEILRRRKRAEELGVKDLVVSLCSELAQLPSRPHNDQPRVVSEFSFPAAHRMDFKMGGHRFSFREYAKGIEGFPMEDPAIALLRLEVDECTVFESQMLSGKARYNLGEIVAFIEGPWISMIREALPMLQSSRKERARADAEAAEIKKLKDLGKRFGIDT